MTVLLLTHSEDNESVRFMLDAIAARGGTAYRLDTDCFPTEVGLEVHHGPAGQRVIVSGPQGRLDLSEVTAVWHRRLRVGKRIPGDMDAQLRSASVDESRAVLVGLVASLDAFHLDWLPAIRNAENKQLQLQVARAVGLQTPRTLSTNEPEAVRAFARECPGGMVAKMLHSFAILEGDTERVVFTSEVRPEHLEDLDSLRYCPMTFQENVPKALELRATVVGGRVFTASIDSQAHAQARTDWRRQGVELVNDWRPYTLPAEVEGSLLRLMDRFGLNYGASDLIVTPEGRHVFLEVNPGGEFFWLERAPGLPISEALAELLLDRAPRRLPRKLGF
ncbi:MAG TPA: MvdD family ATP-grasp ribosomal peptide maturase [Myxococcaceae bacterium]|nr:MvdD family ATP-grasp ribosomal peptide maturase [Myxococcaceae bacterium]